MVCESILFFGSWVSQFSEFQAFCDNRKIEKKLSAMAILEKVSPFLDKIKLPKMEKPNPIMCHLVDINPDAYCGIMCEKIFSRSTHRYMDFLLRPIAKELMEKAMSELVADTTLWTVGGRSRLMDISKLETTLRSRLLIMPDGVTKIVGLAVIQDFYSKLSILQREETDNEILLGTTFRRGFFSKFLKSKESFSDVIEMDLKRFDQHVNEEFIVAAFSILRSCFPEDNETDLLFKHLLGSFLFKNIVVPGGFIYRVSRSVSTGSPFTSIIGSIVNWLNQTLLCLELGILKERRQICVYGDDTLIFLKDFLPISVSDILKDLVKISGHEADPCIIKRVSDPPRHEKGFSFLKTQSYYGLPGRTTEELLEKALFPEQKRSIYTAPDQIEGSFHSAPFNVESMNILYDLYIFLKDQRAKKFGCQPGTSAYEMYMDTASREATIGKAMFLNTYRYLNFERDESVYHWERKAKRFCQKIVPLNFQSINIGFGILKEVVEGSIVNNREDLSFLSLLRRSRSNKYCLRILPD